MWNDLSMSEKNSLIQLYIKNGVTSLDKMKKHYNSFAKGGNLDEPNDEKPYIPGSEQNYGYLKPVEVTADRPEYMYGLTDYDWERANSPYYRKNLGARARFIRDVGTKNLTGQSDYMRDVNKLSYIPNAAVGAIGAIPTAAGLIAATTNPVVDAVLTTHGLITAPKNIKEGIQDIQEGNTWQGIGELGLTALDLTGAGQLLGRTGRMFNKGYRAKHAYNTIMPASYDNPIQRGKEWVRDMWYNEPVDMKTPKWFKQTKTQRDLADSSKMPYEQANMTGYTNTAGYITPGTENAAKIADEARLDAWAIYNGLEPQYGTYIKNADGTYSYDLARIRRISNDTWNPAYTPDNIPFNIKLSAGNGQDFVTGAGGGLTDFRILGTDTHGNGIMRIEDVWDLHPFSRSSDVLSKRIQKKLFPNWEEKFANPMFEKASRVLDWGLSHNSKRIENLGNKMFDASDKPLFGLLEKIDDKMKNFEVGKLTGGKPFKMSTNIKYHLEDPLLSRLETDELGNISFNSGKRVLHYGFTPDYIANIKPIEKDLYNAYDLGVLKDMLKNITKEK